jgi:hypothetical protein
MPYLDGEATGAPHTQLFWRAGGGAKYAVREGEWKLVAGEGGGMQLFNLASDVAETKDLAAARPDVLARLRTAFDDWNKGNIAPVFQSPAGAKPKTAKKKAAKT